VACHFRIFPCNQCSLSPFQKGKNIRFDFDQTDDERDEAIEQLRSNLHQLTNNKESVFYNFQRSPLSAKPISLDKNDHKEFLRAKMEKLKQRKLLESRRQSDHSVADSLEGMCFAENDDDAQRRLHRTSRVEKDRNALNLDPVNGLGKENHVVLSRDEESPPGKREECLSSDDSSRIETPVFKGDFVQRLNRENGEVENRRRRGSDEIMKKEHKNIKESSNVSDIGKLPSNSNSRRSSKLGDTDLEIQGQGHEGHEGREYLYEDDEKTPLVTPRTPFQTPRASMSSENNEPHTVGEPSSGPSGSPTPTASGRGSRISSVSDIQNASVDSSGAPTPTPRMEDYTVVEAFTQAVKAKNTTAAVEEAKELEKVLQCNDTEREAVSTPKVKTVTKSQRSRSVEKNISSGKTITSLPSVGTTPAQTPRIDLKKSKPKNDSKSSEQDSEADMQSRSRSNSSKSQDPPQNTAKRKATRGKIQNPDTPPQTPRLPRSRTHSTETPIRTSSRVDDVPRSRTQSRTGGIDTPRSRTQSRADETPLRTPRTNSRAEESADVIITPRSRSMSTSSQSARSDIEGQGERTRKMPPARSNVRIKGGSLSDSESVVARKTSRGGTNSRSEESLRKIGVKGTENAQKTTTREVKGSRGPVVRRPNISGYSSDKTQEKGTPKKQTTKKEGSCSDLEDSSKVGAPAVRKKSTQKSEEDTNSNTGDKPDRRTSSIKEFREIVTDRLYQLSRTPSTKRKTYKPPVEKEKESSPGQRSSVVSSVASASNAPSIGDASEGQAHSVTSTSRKSSEAKPTRSQATTRQAAEHIRGQNNTKQQKTNVSQQKTGSSSGYSSGGYRKSSIASLASEEGVKPTPSNYLRKMKSLNSEDESMTDGSVVSDADNTSAKESMTSDVDAQDNENALQRRRRRRPRRSLPVIPNMADADLEEKKKQLFSGAKQRLQRVFAESNYDSESSMNKSDIDSQSERGEGNVSRASTLTGREEDERFPLYLISASCPETEDTGDDRVSISSSAFESPKSDDEEIMNVILRGKQRTNFTAEIVPPIKTNFSQPSDSRSGSKVGTHTEEQIYRAKQNLLKGINVTFKSKPSPSSRGYRTDADDETRSGNSTARGYISDQGNRTTSGYVSDQCSISRTHVNAGNLGPLLVRSGGDAAGLPKQLVPLDAEQQKLVAAKYQLLQQQLGSKQEIQAPLAAPRTKRNVINTQTQTDFKKSNFNRPSLQKVLQSCDLFNISIDRGRYLYFGIRLFEGVFQPLSSRHSLRSPRGKRPLIGQNKSAFSRVRPMANEDEIESVISVDRIGDRTAAKQDGRVQEGDYILEVNGNYVMDRSLMEVEGALEMSGTKLDLVIARTKVLNLAKVGGYNLQCCLIKLTQLGS
jgi:hypothetical protein